MKYKDTSTSLRRAAEAWLDSREQTAAEGWQAARGAEGSWSRLPPAEGSCALAVLNPEGNEARGLWDMSCPPRVRSKAVAPAPASAGEISAGAVGPGGRD